jgi:hypothetical protein
MLAVAHRLRKGIGEVESWPASELFEWLAFFELENEAQEAALAESRRKRNSRRG